MSPPPQSIPPQCLKAEDIASAVTFVLSAPPHVQVRGSFRLPAFPVVKVPCGAIDSGVVPSDWRRADEAGGAGVVAAVHGAAGGADRRAAAASPQRPLLGEWGRCGRVEIIY